VEKNVLNELPKDFKDFFEINTLEELDELLYQKIFEICLLMELCNTHNLDSSHFPQTCKIIEQSPFNLDL
jgi:hypothetical protein